MTTMHTFLTYVCLSSPTSFLLSVSYYFQVSISKERHKVSIYFLFIKSINSSNSCFFKSIRRQPAPTFSFTTYDIAQKAAKGHSFVDSPARIAFPTSPAWSSRLLDQDDTFLVPQTRKLAFLALAGKGK